MVFEIFKDMLVKDLSTSLNPCFTGKWFLSSRGIRRAKTATLSLNPCFTGKWFLSQLETVKY